LLLAARPCLAHDAREAAAKHFEKGFAAAGRGDFEEALQEFNEAYAVRPHFGVLYNIGQAQIALGRPLGAIETLGRYLDEGGDQIAADRRGQVSAQIAALEARLAHLSIRTQHPGARIVVDGRSVGRTPLPRSIDLAAGRHEVVASYDGSESTTGTVALGDGELRVLVLELPAPTPESAAAAARQAVLEAASAAEAARSAAAAADAALRVMALTQATARATAASRLASASASRAAISAAGAAAVEEAARGHAAPAGGGR
jgi:tetratricopeptide (TPR) repeat protein